jgi:N-glycosylase/DNA lyase
MKTEYRQLENGLAIRRPAWFSLTPIFECGQNFRFEPYGADGYIGVAYGRVLHVAQTENEIVFYGCTPEEFESVWHRYFALDEDYERLTAFLDTDETMHEALAYGKGLRTLKQDPWEMLIGFIVSQNNNIPRIKKIIAKMCSVWATAADTLRMPCRKSHPLKSISHTCRKRIPALRAKH